MQSGLHMNGVYFRSEMEDHFGFAARQDIQIKNSC